MFCVCSYGDHYEWNKAVTCIHNVLSQQRSLEHYGEVVIRNTKSDICTCKITFVKVRTPHVLLYSQAELKSGLFHSFFNHCCLSHSSPATGALTAVRTRFRVWFWTKLERWYIASEDSGMKALFVTPCLRPSVSGSPVSGTSSFSHWKHLYMIQEGFKNSWYTCYFSCRRAARWPLPVLRLLTLRQRTQWTDTWTKDHPSTYRHAFQTRPEVQNQILFF